MTARPGGRTRCHKSVEVGRRRRRAHDGPQLALTRRTSPRGARAPLLLALPSRWMDNEIVDAFQRPRGGLAYHALRVVRVRQGELEELRPLVEGEALVRVSLELRDAARARAQSDEKNAARRAIFVHL